MQTNKISLFWFRRDLRLEDNIGLFQALVSKQSVLPLFIFDTDILNSLEKDDPRVQFIHELLQDINARLQKHGSGLLVKKGKPIDVWKEIIRDYEIESVFLNKDYEPYAIQRDKNVESLLKEHGIQFKSFKDQVIFEASEVVKDDTKPYTVYTPFKNKWRAKFDPEDHKPVASEQMANYVNIKLAFPSLKEIGFSESSVRVKDFQINDLKHYKETRDFPSKDATSYLSPHLRFGSVSARQIIKQLLDDASSPGHYETFINELIWREFFMQILYHFPKVVTRNFRSKYDEISWRNNADDFKKWCEGKTGYPMVDAGMRQLNQTGYMHNRVRMITAGFLCKHLLIDWKWGEAYFANKLLDYDLSANNGNWQWAAGTGCDAAPYFRIFNPIEQLKKFDKNLEYVNKWIPEYGTEAYPQPMVDHKMARLRALDVYKEGIQKMV